MSLFQRIAIARQLLELIEEPLDKALFTVESKIGFALYQPIDQPVRIIHFVGQEGIRGDIVEKWFCLGNIECHRVAKHIADAHGSLWLACELQTLDQFSNLLGVDSSRFPI